MCQLSNGHGIVWIEGDKALGKSGTEEDSLDLPAEFSICSHFIARFLKNKPGVTGSLFIAKYMERSQPPAPNESFFVSGLII